MERTWLWLLVAAAALLAPATTIFRRQLPWSLVNAASVGVLAAYLCGQVFPAHLVARRGHSHLAGLRRSGRLAVYVSRGTGVWGPPLRIGAPSEIVLIRLRSSPASQLSSQRTLFSRASTK